MLIQHPRIYLDDQAHHTDALFLGGGRVLATGKDALALATQKPEAPTLCLGLQDGACLFPALTDAHLHLWDLGQRRGLLDLKGAPSLAALCERLKSATPAASGWVIGHGWDQHDWPDWDHRSLERLDALFPHTPVCLHRLDYHAVWANSVALRQAGISLKAPPSPEGGHIELGADARPTGVLVDTAGHLVTACIPEPGAREHQEVLCQNAAMLHAHGISCGHMAWMRASDLDWLMPMRDQGTLPLRIYCMIEAKDADKIPSPFHDPAAWCSTRCIKYFADGAMGSKGALMHEPYRQEDHCGLAVIPAAQLAKEIPGLIGRGFQVAVHAIGDLGATGVLDAFAQADPQERAAIRPRLEHAQIMCDEDIRRLGVLGVIASIQPIHLRSDAPWAHKVLRPHQLGRLFKWRALAQHAELAGGSDFPIDDPNPWHGIATAMSRQGANGQVFQAEDALARQEALALYLSGAAKAAHWEHDLGGLLPGFCADFICLPHDPFECTVEQLWGMEVAATWIGGKNVWQRGA